MSNQDYKRVISKFINGGMDLNDPVDLQPPAKFPFLRNVRAYLGSPMQGRQGLTQLIPASGTGLCHSIKRLNDDSSAYGGFTRIFGIGSVVYYGKTTATLAQSGFSGNPLTLVAYRPDQSVVPWMYIGDSLLLWKVSSVGNSKPVGYTSPAEVLTPSFFVSTTPNVNPTYPKASIAHTFINATANSDEAYADWTQTGTAGAPALIGAKRIDTTISAILYDSGTIGWACFNPASMVGIGEGTRVLLSVGSEYALIHSVHQGSKTDTTIESIAYDTGTAGICSIQLTIELDGLERDAFVKNTSQTLYAKVISVTVGPDGRHSMRLDTGGSTWAATDGINILPSFRIFTVNTQAAAGTIKDEAITSAVTVGTGHLTQSLTIDLNRIAGQRPTQNEDWVHISMRFDNPANLAEGRIQFDVDSASNDFLHNYYYYSFRPSDFTTAIQFTATTQSVLPLTVTRQLLDQFNNQVSDAPNVELSQTGNLQWYELWFRISDLIRVGTDDSRTLANVAKVRISFNVTGTTQCDFDSLEIAGSYGPDIDKTAVDGYYYRYRPRDSSTGARGRWSLPTKSPVWPRRQRVTLTIPGYEVVSADKLDIQRFGGLLTEWTYVGTTANDSSGANVTFFDDYSDADIAGNLTGDDDVRAPFPVQDIPQPGTGFAAGTTLVTVTGAFNKDWVRGMTINVSGINYTVAGFTRKEGSIWKLETVESMGTQGSIGSPILWNAPSPVIEGAPIPSIWGPIQGFLFACGDTRNQGWLYFCAGNDPDNAPETHKVELTSPSEPLVAGCDYDGRCFVFSSENLYAVYPSFGGFSLVDPTIQSTNLWRPLKVPNSKGLFSRWTLAVGPTIWFLSKDGIYETAGGEPVSITNQDLYALFPHDGQQGSSIVLAGVTVFPPQMDVAATAVPANLRLSYYDSELFFDFIGTDGNFYTLIYNTITKSWGVDVYARTINYHYGEDGHGIRKLLAIGNDVLGTKGEVYEMVGESDDGDRISCRIRTPSKDDGDPDVKKLWGDTLLDIDPENVTVSVVQGFDQHSNVLAAQTITGNGRQRVELVNNLGVGTQGYNASLDITWDLGAAGGSPPTISSISPSTIAIGGGAFTLTVNGTNFTPTSVVRWNGAARVTTYISDVKLTAAILAADVAVAGTFKITVFNPV